MLHSPICSLPGLAAVSPQACAFAARSCGSITQLPAVHPREKRGKAVTRAAAHRIHRVPSLAPFHSSPAPGTLRLSPCFLSPALLHLLIVSVPLLRTGEDVICSSLAFSSVALSTLRPLHSSCPAEAMKDSAFIASPLSCSP